MTQPAGTKGELSEGKARDLLARIYEISTGDKLRFHTVRSWATDWLAKKIRTAKPATAVVYKAHVEAFVAWLGDKADGRLESITKRNARDFRDAIQD
ncbi:hypothetical protein HQ447_19240, partial [bacterium]|nr:hypothetical protein [bacterium]